MTRFRPLTGIYFIKHDQLIREAQEITGFPSPYGDLLY